MNRFIKKIILLGLIASVFSGCSKDFFWARVLMFKAEGAYDKAYRMKYKFKEIGYDDRLKVYGQACELFHEAYRRDSGVFTLNRIYAAQDSCARVQDQDKISDFDLFIQEYIQTHPKEYDYGDTDATIPE